MEEGGHVKIYNGNYSAYRLELEENKQQAKKGSIVDQPAAPVQKKNKLSFKENKELETLESEISGIEERLKQKNEELNISGIAPNRLAEVLKEIEKLHSLVNEKSIRWLELSELKEQ